MSIHYPLHDANSRRPLVLAPAPGRDTGNPKTSQAAWITEASESLKETEWASERGVVVEGKRGCLFLSLSLSLCLSARIDVYITKSPHDNVSGAWRKNPPNTMAASL